MIVYGATLDTPTIVKACNDKAKHNVRLAQLEDYYEGNQAILQRHYDDPTKPNNRIVVNYCKDIADFITSYVVGQPVKVTAPQAVLDAMAANDEQAELQDVVHDMTVCGFGCELFYFDECGEVHYDDIDPTECIVFYDDDLKSHITGFVRMVKQPDETYDVTVYDSTSVWTYKLNAALSQLTLVEDAYEHHFGDVPIVFYPNGHDMQGNFEQVIPLQDALNKVVSDSVNDWESFVDSYLVLENMQGTTQDDIAAMKANRVLLTDPDSKAYWLTKTADNDRIKTLQDDLRGMILELGNVPDLKDITGLSVSGEAMKFKLTKTEIQASRIERIVTAGIMRKVLLLSNVLSLTTQLEAVDVEIEFTRNFIMTGEEV